MFYYSDHLASGTCAELEKPDSRVVFTRNESLTVSNGPIGGDGENVIQLKPQEVQVKIRNGKSLIFKFLSCMTIDFTRMKS